MKKISAGLCGVLLFVCVLAGCGASEGVTAYSAEQRRRGDKCAASCGRKSAQHLYWHSETEKLSTRPRRVGRRD